MGVEQPIKVAIIGGGCAGVTAAFELSHPRHGGKFEVTVFQQGFRLGGKGASGRGPADRIEEHGLHLWMGFYENAFRVMRECYAELGRDPERCRIATWQDAFVPDPVCGVMDQSPDGRWLPWTVAFPATPGLPGDPDGSARWSVADYLQRSIVLVRTLLETIRAGMAGAAQPTGSPATSEAPSSEFLRWIGRLPEYTSLAGFGGLIQVLSLLDEVARFMPKFPGEAILRFHEALAGSARVEIERMTSRDDGLRRLWEVVELVLATIRGIVSEGLVTDKRGFSAIDGFDCREWLQKHGASKQATESAFLRALYDLAFAYEDGDVTRGKIAAGQAVRGAVRAFFTYRGAFFWKMQAGMGDVVFAPLYEVMVRRGVRFELFHRLQNIGLGPAAAGERPHVATLKFAVQAKTRDNKPYQPLVDVRGLPCWPSDPDFAQLEDGARMKREGWAFESHWDQRCVEEKELQVKKDFDLVVLAVGLGAVPIVGSEILASDKRWREMIARCKTVPTQALQLWLKKDIHELGWKGPSVNVSGYVEPFDTWADMPQLIAEESFPTEVKAVAYYCSVLPDAPPAGQRHPEYPWRRLQEVRRNAINFMNRDIQGFWPNATDGKGNFRWDLLVAPDGSTARRATEARIDTQYIRANVDPSDRYSLSLPGSLSARISPLDQTYDNLTVAGDWTDCGFNEGCVEAAVMSGLLAAHSLSLSPPLEQIVGFDHP